MNLEERINLEALRIMPNSDKNEEISHIGRLINPKIYSIDNNDDQIGPIIYQISDYLGGDDSKELKKLQNQNFSEIGQYLVRELTNNPNSLEFSKKEEYVSQIIPNLLNFGYIKKNPEEKIRNLENFIFEEYKTVKNRFFDFSEDSFLNFIKPNKIYGLNDTIDTKTKDLKDIYSPNIEYLSKILNEITGLFETNKENSNKIIYEDFSKGLKYTGMIYDHVNKNAKEIIKSAGDVYRMPPVKGKKIFDTSATIGIQEAELVPEKHRMLFASLVEHYQAVEFVGMVKAGTISKNDVDVLTFNVVENGAPKSITMFAKQMEETEAQIARFLYDIGVNTYRTYGDGSSVGLQSVGTRDLREAIQIAPQKKVLKHCMTSIDLMAKMHVRGTSGLRGLRHDYGVQLPVINYGNEFIDRFVTPLSSSEIVSLGGQRLSMAYNKLMTIGASTYFSHGDLHTRNLREDNGEQYVIDFDMARVASNMEDFSRFVNSVMTDRKDFECNDFRYMAFSKYVAEHNRYAKDDRHALMLKTGMVEYQMKLALVNDHLFKIGDKISFAMRMPEFYDIKVMEALECFDKAVLMLDDMYVNSDLYGERARDISVFRKELVDYVKNGGCPEMKAAADKYSGNITLVKSKPIVHYLKAA